jgi:acetyltransferase
MTVEAAPPPRAAFPSPVQPYPDHLVQRVVLRDGSEIVIRPIRPEDAEIEQAFVRNLSDESRYYRFMDTVRELSPRMLAHFTRVDYHQHLALIAVTPGAAGETQIGVARYFADTEGQRCEFAIVVADAWQQKGLGTRLMRALMDAARRAGLRVMYGDVLASNHRMLQLMTALGFSLRFEEQDPHVLRAEIQL